MRRLAIGGMVLCAGAALSSCRGNDVTFVPASGVPTTIVLRDMRTWRGEDDRFAIGEAINQSNEPAAFWISFRFWDKAGLEKHVDSHVLLPATCGSLYSTGIVWPGEKMPCETMVPRDAVTASYRIDLLESEPGEVFRTRANLKVVGAELRSDRVDGWVASPRSSWDCDVQVGASFYDSSGRIVGWGLDRIGSIKPGARAPFEVLTRGVRAPVASFTATAWTWYPNASKCD